MSRKPNSLFVVFTLLVLFSLVLSACAPAAPEPTAEPPAQEEPTKAPEPTKEEVKPTEAPTMEPPVEITYYYASGAQADLELVQEEMNKILLDKINVTIKLVPIDWGAFNDQVNLMFSSGEACDVVFTAPWINNYFQAVNNEALLPLDDLLQSQAPELWASIKPEYWDATRVGGMIYGVPNQQIWVKTWGPAAREDLATKYNLDMSAVTKWEDLEPFMQALVENEPDVIAFDGAPQFRHEIYGWDPLDDGIGYDDVSIVGANALGDKLTAINVLETPEFQNYVETMRRWYLAGYLPKETDPDAAASWKAGKYVLWSHLIAPDLKNAGKINYGWDFVGKPLTDPVIMTTSSVIATMNGICASSKNPEKAMQYLNLINTDPDLYNLFVYGIEGKHWVWKDQAKKLIAPPEGKAWDQTGYGGIAWMFGNTFNGYYNGDFMADNDINDKTRELNNSATASLAMGFSFNRENVQTEIANVKAAAQEFCAPMTEGQADPAEALPECIAKVKEAGIDTIVAEMQKQLDAFEAAK
jgi:putative aldouronate transport system substrate-binding protein